MTRVSRHGKTGIGRTARVFAALVAAALITAGCGGQEAGEATQEAGAATPADQQTEAGTSPEVGTWETDTIARSEFLDTLAQADLQRYGRDFQQREDWLPEREAVMSLELGDGSWTLYASFDGEPPAVWDRQTYEAVDERFVVTSTVGQSVFQPSIEDDELTLSYVSSTEPAVEGVPVEAVLRVLYTTSPFRRLAS